MSYNSIKLNYDHGLWTKSMVRMAVKKGLITAAQFEEITGTPYVTDELTPKEALDIILKGEIT